ncbi:serine protease persephone-like [Asbolus verrucosus]|uniref:Serine protease persephone-like n=1 Tax=Asbolus verrucosus TaxID=1661398 RepID=A0A482VQ18_ASBVE|nr:serine protease persephone-like [Asbolus verrucosus]
MDHLLHLILVAAVFVADLDCFTRQLYEGSKCQNDDSSGVCTLVPDCPLALESIRRSGTTGMVRCGFDRDIEIVCCPGPNVKNTTQSSKETDDGDDGQTEVRAPNLVSRSAKACESYAKQLPVVLTYHIVGGENADPGEFPHMAALGFYNDQDQVYKFDCGGTLISNHYIVTAAHCIINVEQNQLKIARMGVVDVPATVAKPDPKLDYNIDNVTVHREYNWKEKFNDIALVRLQKKVTFTDFIRPACLYTKNDDPQRLIVSGWGALSLGGEKSNVLQKATLTAVPLQDCNSTYLARTRRNVVRSQICAADDRSDACQGDSGGPLQIQTNRSLLTIVGVTSYGIGCGSKYPGIYTRINSYVGWIEGIVWP